jgi:hypothetical protein
VPNRSVDHSDFENGAAEVLADDSAQHDSSQFGAGLPTPPSATPQVSRRERSWSRELQGFGADLPTRPSARPQVVRAPTRRASFDVVPFGRRPERGSHKPAQGNALGNGVNHPSSSPERAKQPVRSETHRPICRARSQPAPRRDTNPTRERGLRPRSASPSSQFRSCSPRIHTIRN